MNTSLQKAGALGMARYRWAVTSRFLAAVAGGYGLSAAFSAALGLACAHWWGMGRADAVTLSTMLSFVVFAVAVLWAFACRNAWWAWLGIALPALVMLAVVGALYGRPA